MVTANNYMFRPLTGHHQVVYLKKRLRAVQYTLGSQKHNYMCVCVCVCIYIYIYRVVFLTFKRLLFNFMILTNTTGISHLKATVRVVQ